MKSLPRQLSVIVVGVTLLGIGTARSETGTALVVDFQFDNVSADQDGFRELRVSAGFPEHSELIIHGQLLKAIADDGTDLLPKDAAKRELIGAQGGTQQLNLFRGKMRTNIWFPIRTYDSQKVHALRELAGTFTCLVGEWKEIDLGLTGFRAGQRGTQHGATIESIKPWTLGGGTQMLRLFLDVPLGASEKFVLTDAAGKPIDASMMQQEAAPGGSVTTFLLKDAAAFPEAGKIKARILEAKPVTMPFAFTNFSLTGTAK